MAQLDPHGPIPSTVAPINPIDPTNAMPTGEPPSACLIQPTPTEVPVGVKRLHVTNLPFRVSEADLGEMFGVSPTEILFLFFFASAAIIQFNFIIEFIITFLSTPPEIR